MGLLRSCFARTQTWLQAGKYLNALATDLPSRNGWTIGEQAGDRSPAKAQRLVNRASWDEEAAMSQVRRYAAAGLDAAAGRSRRRRMTVGAPATGPDASGHPGEPPPNAARAIPRTSPARSPSKNRISQNGTQLSILKGSALDGLSLVAGVKRSALHVALVQHLFRGILGPLDY